VSPPADQRADAPAPRLRGASIGAGVLLLAALTGFAFWLSARDTAALNAARQAHLGGGELPPMPLPEGRTGGPQDGE
jgi:hypothetical protein